LLSPKQIELSHMLFYKIEEKFPEIEIIYGYNIKYPHDKDRQIELYELSGDKSTDILLDCIN